MSSHYNASDGRKFERQYPWIPQFVGQIRNLNSIDLVHLLVILSNDNRSSNSAKQLFAHTAHIMYTYHRFNQYRISKMKSSSTKSYFLRPKPYLGIKNTTRRLFGRGGGGKKDKNNSVDIIVSGLESIVDDEIVIARNMLEEKGMRVTKANIQKMITLLQQQDEVKFEKMEREIESTSSAILDDINQETAIVNAKTEREAAKQRNQMLNHSIIPPSTQFSIGVKSLVYACIAKLMVDAVHKLSMNLGSKAGQFIYNTAKNTGETIIDSSMAAKEAIETAKDLTSITDKTIGYLFHGVNLILNPDRMFGTLDLTQPELPTVASFDQPDILGDQSQSQIDEDPRITYLKSIVDNLYHSIPNNISININDIDVMIGFIVCLISMIYLFNYENREYQAKRNKILGFNNTNKNEQSKRSLASTLKTATSVLNPPLGLALNSIMKQREPASSGSRSSSRSSSGSRSRSRGRSRSRSSSGTRRRSMRAIRG